MNRNRAAELRGRLESYSSNAKSDIAPAALRDRLRSWGIYATVSGSALAAATSASAGTIVAFSGPPAVATREFTHIAGLNTSTLAALPFNVRWGTSRRSNIDRLSGYTHQNQQRILQAGFARFAWGSALESSPGFAGSVRRLSFPRLLAPGQKVSASAGVFNSQADLLKLHATGLRSSFVPSSGPFMYQEVLSPVSVDAGNFQAGAPGYIGVRLRQPNISATGSGPVLYGWAEVVFDAGPNGVPDSVTILKLAYDTTGAPIVVGDSGANPTPEPATAGMMLLALGAAGVAALRKSKAARLKQTAG